LVCAAWLLWAGAARAQEPKGSSPTLFWLSASATIVCASIGGFYALEVKDLYDEAQLSPPVSPERGRIHDEMRNAELTADVLLLSSLVMAVGTTVLAFHTDWSGRERSGLVLHAAGSGARASFTLDPGARRPQPTAAGPGSWW
jgi:hypothetical protein